MTDPNVVLPVSAEGPQADIESLTAMALRRVRRGGIVRYEGRLHYRGRPIPPGQFGELLDHLVDVGMLQVADTDEYGLCLVSLSEAGQASYLALCQARPAPLPPPAHSTGEPDSEERRGWCIAACGCSVVVPDCGAVYVDCLWCAPSATNPAPADHRLSDPCTPAPGDRPDPTWEPNEHDHG